MEDAPPIEDEDEEPTSEHVDGLELIFGRGRSGYKDVYPHRKGWQAKVFVEDKGVCSLGIFKDKKQAAIAVARAKAAGLYLLPSPDKTRAKPGCGSAQKSRALLANPFHVFSQALLLDSCCTSVKRKYPSTPANLPTFSMASLENSSSQLATVPARPLGSVAWPTRDRLRSGRLPQVVWESLPQSGRLSHGVVLVGLYDQQPAVERLRSARYNRGRASGPRRRISDRRPGKAVAAAASCARRRSHSLASQESRTFLAQQLKEGRREGGRGRHDLGR